MIKEFRILVSPPDPKAKNADVASAARLGDLQDYAALKAAWRTVIEVTYVDNGATYLWTVLAERT